MSEIKVEPKPKKKKRVRKKRPRGFAGVIWGMLGMLNDSEYFKENYAEDDFSILLYATDDKHAGLITVKNAVLSIEDVKVTPESLKDAKKRSDGLIQCDFEAFMGLAMGKLNPVKAILTRKLKIRGVRTVLKFTKYFTVVGYMMAEQKKAREAAAAAKLAEQE